MVTWAPRSLHLICTFICSTHTEMSSALAPRAFARRADSLLRGLARPAPWRHPRLRGPRRHHLKYLTRPHASTTVRYPAHSEGVSMTAWKPIRSLSPSAFPHRANNEREHLMRRGRDALRLARRTAS